MELEILPHSFSICKVSEFESNILSQPFVFIAGTDQEYSVICPSEYLPPKCTVSEPGWRAFRVTGQMEFSMVGVLARMSGILADAEIPLCAVSTFNTDYIFVKENNFSEAKRELGKCFSIV